MYERYKKLRDSMGMKDAQVAKGSGVARSTFSDWKSGRSEPKNDKLKRIALFFGVSVSYFTDEEEPDELTSNSRLFTMWLRLNEEGQDKLLSYARDLISSGLYEKKYDSPGMVESA